MINCTYFNYICTPMTRMEGAEIVPFFFSMNEMIEDKIAKVLEVRYQEADLSGCFLVEVKSLPHSKLEVYIDADDQLTIEMCRKTSRFLEKQIEEHGWMPEKYKIDVSSPGLDNPLKMKRQYVKNIGRKASIKLSEDLQIEGVLKSVSDKEVVVVIDKEEQAIPWDDIRETKILVSF